MTLNRQSGLPAAVKALLDRSLALSLLLLLSPVMAVIAALILVTTGSPVLFRQKRPGREARIFELLKFRTMADRCDAAGRQLPDGERLTRTGRFLRAWSLDELPQLWNVVRGELSFVGPRPLLVEYLSRYSDDQMRRHEVMPGITGWAQVNGRNAITWDEKFRLDVWYVDHWSLRLDARVMLLTIARVLRREGISQPGQATMIEFRGSNSDEAREQGGNSDGSATPPQPVGTR